MAYIRKRITKTGAVSTALVEAYRDRQGRPRQRILANLHGEPDTLRALVRLLHRRANLQKHREEQWVEAQSGKYSKKLVAWFFARIDADLSAMEKKLAVIAKHCTATADEIQAAIEEHKRALHDAECLVSGMAFINGMRLQEAKANLRRLRR